MNKELKDYTVEELRRELRDREYAVDLAKWNKPDEDVRDYEEVEYLVKRDWHNIYIGSIQNGSEPFQFMIQVHRDTSEEEVLKIVKDNYLKLEEFEWSEDVDIWDVPIESIEIEEFGRYGFFCLKESNTKDSY